MAVKTTKEASMPTIYTDGDCEQVDPDEALWLLEHQLVIDHPGVGEDGIVAGDLRLADGVDWEEVTSALEDLHRRFDPIADDTTPVEAAGVPEYDQLADRDDLIVAKEALESLFDYKQNDSSEENAPTLHGLDTAITVLGKLIERLPNPNDEEVS